MLNWVLFHLSTTKMPHISPHSPQTAELSVTHSFFSQVLQNVLNHSNKISLCKPEGGQQNSSLKVEANGGSSPASDTSTDSKFTPPESQSPLHFLADLAEQKSREEKKGGYRTIKLQVHLTILVARGRRSASCPVFFLSLQACVCLTGRQHSTILTFSGVRYRPSQLWAPTV